MKILKEKELLELIQSDKEVVLFEDNHTVNPIIRLFGKYDKKASIQFILYEEEKKGKNSRFGIKVRKLSRKEMITEEEKEGKTVIVIQSGEEERDKRNEKEILDAGFDTILMLDNEYYFEMQKEENQRQEFLCVGFSKCGTTSLHAALKENKKIFLPWGKETFYLNWKNGKENAPELYKQKYFKNVRPGHTVGAIEPSYYKRAKEAFACFGKDTKIIFMMRNPVKATYSYYRMMMRRPRKPEYLEYYKKYGKYTLDMFSDYIENDIATRKQNRYFYDVWIDEYIKYFGREQVMFIFFEEIIKEPEKILNQVQEFIGVKKKKIQELPFSNEGNYVSKNYLSAKINYHYFKVKISSKKELEVSKKKRLFLKVADKLQKFTCVEATESMTAEQKKRLEEIYRESVNHVEALCGRSLRDIWY